MTVEKKYLWIIIIAIIIITFCGEIGYLLAESLLVVAVITLPIVLLRNLIKAKREAKQSIYTKDFSLKIIAMFMGFLLIIGILMYLYVFDIIATEPVSPCQSQPEFSYAERLYRAFICSLDLFMLDVDTNILDRLDSHPILKGVLAVLAVASFSCTVAMLVSLIFSRFKAYLRLRWATKITNDKNHLYLFFGNNEPSKLLIKSIFKNESDKAIAIIIDEADLNEDNNDEWESIVSLFTHKPRVFNDARKINAHVAIAGTQLKDIDDDISSKCDFNAFAHLGINSIKRLIDKLLETKDPELHIFFLDENEDSNIRNIRTLAKDSTISSMSGRNVKMRIYCHARSNGPNKVIEDLALNKGFDVKIVDSSHLAVEMLKINEKLHPVNVVKLSDKHLTTVASPLTALIVGFGEVGRDAFRFLYEFGAFVDANDHDKRSPFECVIVDKDMSLLKGMLISSMPGIFTKDNSIKFIEANYKDTTFNTQVLTDAFLRKVNYIIISISDNDEAIFLATNIFNRALSIRDDMSDLRIVVRCNDDKKLEDVKKIADHYNYGYGGSDRANNPPVIEIFGAPSSTYTYDLVVCTKLEREAKAFYEKYAMVSNKHKTWEERRKELTDNMQPIISDLRALRRKEAQDFANALHTGTKIYLLKEAMRQLYQKQLTNKDWETFYNNYFLDEKSVNVCGHKDKIKYPKLTPQQNCIIMHLAQLEHLRWVAAHELLGYVFDEDITECNDLAKRHNCMCPWSKIDAQSDKITDWECDYKSYDFFVVDTTLLLKKETLIASSPKEPEHDDAS